MEGSTESEEKQGWLDRILDRAVLLAVGLIVGIAEIVSVNDPSLKGRLWSLELGIFVFIFVFSLSAGLFSLAQQRMQWLLNRLTRNNRLEVYWKRVEKYADSILLSATALLVLYLTRPLILSLPDLAIENVEIVSEVTNDGCSITRPKLQVAVTNRGNAPAGKFRLTILSEVDSEPNEIEYPSSVLPGGTKKFTFSLGTLGDPSLVAAVWPDIPVRDKEPKNNSSVPKSIPPVCTPTPTPTPVPTLTPTPVTIPEPPIMGFTVLVPQGDDSRNLQPVLVEPGGLLPVPVKRNSLLHIAVITNPGFGEAAEALIFRWKPSTGEVDEEEKGPTVSYIAPDRPGLVSIVIEVWVRDRLISTRTFDIDVR